MPVLQAQLQTMSARWKKKNSVIIISCNFLGNRAKPKHLESKQKLFVVGSFFSSSDGCKAKWQNEIPANG